MSILILSAKIVNISDHVKLKMNNKDKIPLITGLAIDDIIRSSLNANHPHSPAEI